MGSFKDKLVQAGLASRSDIARAEAERRDAARRQQETVEEEAAANHLAAAPRYPGAAPIRLADVRALFAPYREQFAELERGATIDGVLDPEIFTLPSAQIIDGNVALDALVLPREGSNLIVRGDLTIAGILRQEFRAGGLVVLGRLAARHIVTTGSLLCFGDLTVVGTLYGNCTNYATDVLGHARAAVAISAKGHLFSFWGSHAIAGVVNVNDDGTNLDDYGPPIERPWRPDLAHIFDEDAVFAALRDHDSLFADAGEPR